MHAALASCAVRRGDSTPPGFCDAAASSTPGVTRHGRRDQDAVMINPINPAVLRTNDALSKQQNQDRRRNRKRGKDDDEAEENTVTPEGEGEHLDLVA